MKKIIFLSFALCWTIQSYGQLIVDTNIIDDEIEYSCVLESSNMGKDYCKEGGLAAEGETLFSDIYISNEGSKYKAEEGFGFCKIYTYDSSKFESAHFHPWGNFINYAFIHSENQNLVLVRLLSNGTYEKVWDFGRYKSIICVTHSYSASSIINITATNTTGGTINLSFNTSILNSLPKIVVNVEVSSITLDQSSITIEKGTTKQLVATVLPEIATNKELEWITSDASIVTVENGLVSGVKEGMAIITAKASDGSNTMAQCITIVQASSGIKPGSIVKRVEGVYTLDGKKVSTFSKGIYVIRMEDGKTQKITVK